MVVAPNEAPSAPPNDVVIIFALDLACEDEARETLLSLCLRYGQTPLVIDAEADPLFADAVKDPSTRAHFPLLCVRGALVGGAEVVGALESAGKLHELFAPNAAERPPAIALSRAAAEELSRAMTEPGAFLRILVTESFEHDLIVDEAKSEDIHLTLGGIPCVLDPESASRADGMAIDWIVAEDAQGFRIDNPNRPEPVKYVDADWLVPYLDETPTLLVIDARTKGEYDREHLPQARLLDATLIDELDRTEPHRPLFFYCQNGVRSRVAAESYREEGHLTVFCLSGGLAATPQPSTA